MMSFAAVVDETLTASFPAPDDLFERAVLIQNIESAFEPLKKVYEKRRIDLISEIRSKKLVSDCYYVAPKIEHHVDCNLLREKHPELFERIVYVQAPDARKILGDRKMYEFCKITDAKLTREYDFVKIGDLTKSLGKEKADMFVASWENYAKMKVLPKEDL